MHFYILRVLEFRLLWQISGAWERFMVIKSTDDLIKMNFSLNPWFLKRNLQQFILIAPDFNCSTPSGKHFDLLSNKMDSFVIKSEININMSCIWEMLVVYHVCVLISSWRAQTPSSGTYLQAKLWGNSGTDVNFCFKNCVPEWFIFIGIYMMGEGCFVPAIHLLWKLGEVKLKVWTNWIWNIK